MATEPTQVIKQAVSVEAWGDTRSGRGSPCSVPTDCCSGGKATQWGDISFFEEKSAIQIFENTELSEF